MLLRWNGFRRRTLKSFNFFNKYLLLFYKLYKTPTLLKKTYPPKIKASLFFTMPIIVAVLPDDCSSADMTALFPEVAAILADPERPARGHNT